MLSRFLFSLVRNPGRTVHLLVLILGLSMLLAGCANGPATSAPNPRPFTFGKDTFAYANELVWEYDFDATGAWTAHRRDPKPDYTLHCFVVARSARQFFQNATFDPSAPEATVETYRKLIRAVVSTNPRKPLPAGRKIVIPGYADLLGFSRAHEQLLKDECGPASQSYLQRGNWRTIFPFSRRYQAKVAGQLWHEIHNNSVSVVHLVRFPDLKINHAMLIFDATETATGIQFSAYDPNDPVRPTTLTYDGQARMFTLPRNKYFPGGKVNVYEIYSAWNY